LGENYWLSDKNLTVFASSFPNLELLDLSFCSDWTSEGICHILRRCYKITHLDLTGCNADVDIFEMNFVLPKLQVLDLSSTDVEDETLYAISKRCSQLLKLSLIGCDLVTEKGVKDVVENCKQLREIVLEDSDVSDTIRELAMDAFFASVLKFL
jgi:hypothetical protein